MIGRPSVAGEEPTVYPEEERVGEEMLQRWIAELLRPLLERWLNSRGQHFVGADQFVYYEQYNPRKRYAPDVYVLRGVPPQTRVRWWKTWQTGIAPSFALEVSATPSVCVSRRATIRQVWSRPPSKPSAPPRRRHWRGSASSRINSVQPGENAILTDEAPR